jgi:hypothetical protein
MIPAIATTATASQKPCGYEAPELKELNHRLDGVLWPLEQLESLAEALLDCQGGESLAAWLSTAMLVI